MMMTMIETLTTFNDDLVDDGDNNDVFHVQSSARVFRSWLSLLLAKHPYQLFYHYAFYSFSRFSLS